MDGLPGTLQTGAAPARGHPRRSLGYHVARIRKLGLTGAKVLDANCGMGTWSFALRSQFDEVVGIDAGEKRIGVARWLADRGRVAGMDFRVGTVLDCALPPGSFDAVFCHSLQGPRFPAKETLETFRHLLRPGGLIYVCLADPGWDPEPDDADGESLPAKAALGWRYGPDQIACCAKNLWRRALGHRTGSGRRGRPRGYVPEDVETLCNEVGFIDFQWACEGLIAGAVLADMPEPLFEGYVDGHLNVWEFLAFKPDTELSNRIEPEWFIANARHAAQLPYLAQARRPLITNVDAATMPRGWIEEARRRAAAAGGERLVARLAEKLCDGANDTEDCLERLIGFAQDVLVPHPIVQPIEFNGAVITDPATLLFLGTGRCGAAAPLIVSLCEAVGIPARTEQVSRHVFAVADCGGDEILVEADYFKQGVVPRDPDGRLQRYRAFLEDPRCADPLPDCRTWWVTHFRNSTDIWGRRPTGYRVSDGAVRIYSCHFHDVKGARFKPKVPILKAGRIGRMVRISWNDAKPIDESDVEYRLVIRDVSRGWNYETQPVDMASVLSPPPVAVDRWVDDGTGFEIDWPGSAYLEVTPRLKERRDVFCWPSNEVQIAAANP